MTQNLIKHYKTPHLQKDFKIFEGDDLISIIDFF